VEHPKVQFILKGFSEVTGSRVFAFEGVAADRSRLDFTVKTDLALARRYGIRLQELPLLCKAVLERKHEGDVETRTFTYTEADMGQYADSAAARVEAAKNRKPARRPAAANLGTAWRVPQP
jgi:hypothetical protein